MSSRKYDQVKWNGQRNQRQRKLECYARDAFDRLCMHCLRVSNFPKLFPLFPLMAISVFNISVSFLNEEILFLTPGWCL